MKLRNRFVLLLNLLLIILSVLGLQIVTNGCKTDKRMARIVSVYPLCEASVGHFPSSSINSATSEARTHTT